MRLKSVDTHLRMNEFHIVYLSRDFRVRIRNESMSVLYELCEFHIAPFVLKLFTIEEQYVFL